MELDPDWNSWLDGPVGEGSQLWWSVAIVGLEGDQRTLPVTLVESELSGTVRSGLTGNYVRVDFESETVRPNELVDVLITGSDQERCYGTIVSVDDNPKVAQELAVNEGGNAR